MTDGQGPPEEGGSPPRAAAKSRWKTIADDGILSALAVAALLGILALAGKTIHSAIDTGGRDAFVSELLQACEVRQKSAEAFSRDFGVNAKSDRQLAANYLEEQQAFVGSLEGLSIPEASEKQVVTLVKIETSFTEAMRIATARHRARTSAQILVELGSLDKRRAERLYKSLGATKCAAGLSPLGSVHAASDLHQMEALGMDSEAVALSALVGALCDTTVGDLPSGAPAVILDRLARRFREKPNGSQWFAIDLASGRPGKVRDMFGGESSRKVQLDNAMRTLAKCGKSDLQRRLASHARVAATPNSSIGGTNRQVQARHWNSQFAQIKPLLLNAARRVASGESKFNDGDGAAAYRDLKQGAFLFAYGASVARSEASVITSAPTKNSAESTASWTSAAAYAVADMATALRLRDADQWTAARKRLSLATEA